MEKYEELLRKEIKDIKQLLSKPMTNRNFDITSLDLCTLYNLVDELKLDIDKKEVFRGRNIYREDKTFTKLVAKNYFESLEFNQEYLSNIDQFDYLKYEKEPLTKDIDSSILIAVKFLKNAFPNLYNELKRIIEEGKIIIKPMEETKESIGIGGITYASIKTFTPYIVLKDDETFDLAHEIVHEIAHSYIYTKRKVLSTKRNLIAQANGLEEVYTHFINLSLNEAIKGTNIEKYSNSYIESLIGSFLIKINELKDNLENEEINAYQYTEQISYSYGLAISYLFFDRYKQDKKQALRELKEFLENITKYSFIKSIEKSKLDKDLIDKKILLKYI